MVNDQNLVERVQDAIAKALWEYGVATNDPECKLARAAIEAMEEPTEIMMRAGTIALPGKGGPAVRRRARLVWKAMVQAAPLR